MKKIGQILFTVILFEIALGGGGRLTTIGPLSLRMVLFSLAQALTLYFFVKGERLSRTYWRLCIIFAITLLAGLGVGLLAEAERTFWWEDVKPLLYFFLLPFFGYVADHETPEKSAKIFRFSSILLAALFFVTLLVIHVFIPFMDFYRFTLPTQEFFFRGEVTFFYKGFLFLGIGCIFSYFSDARYKTIIIALLVAAILASITRGLLLALSLTFVCYFLSRTRYSRTFFLLVVALMILLGGNLAIQHGSELFDQFVKGPADRIADLTLLGDRNYSDNGRLDQMKQVWDRITPFSFFLGHGFGCGIPSRPIHMEIAYLEILHKQGLVGLAFWGFLFWITYRKFRAARPGHLTHAFFFSSLFVYFQSLTNQYLNNPIGLSVILLSVVCLDQLKAIPQKE